MMTYDTLEFSAQKIRKLIFTDTKTGKKYQIQFKNIKMILQDYDSSDDDTYTFECNNVRMCDDYTGNYYKMSVQDGLLTIERE